MFRNRDTIRQLGEVLPCWFGEPAPELSREGADCAGEAGVAGALAGTPAQQPGVQVGRLVTLVVQAALVAPHPHSLSLSVLRRGTRLGENKSHRTQSICP
jgi:hypothetical protein